jgi:rod shape-determining protein MreB
VIEFQKIIAVGKEANLMQGKTHENIKTIRPEDGVIADFDASENDKYFIKAYQH